MVNSPTEFISLDDLLYATYYEILQNGVDRYGKRGKFKEVINYSATLENPRVRTSMSLHRNLVQSKFAEFAWYLSKKDDKNYIKPYISVYEKEEQKNNKILGAYGSKIFGSKNGKPSQYERVVEQIIKRNSTKQAFLVISEKNDYKYREKKYQSPPCTIGLHFYVRDDKLNLTCYMRSNDAFYGLPHDLFCFTMLQELISCKTKIPLGKYTHVSTSMHIYDKQIGSIKKYLSEGKQEPIEMPKIKECSFKTLELISKEFDVNEINSNSNYLDNYWKDFALFSKRYINDNELDSKTWLKMFKSKDMYQIAHNSISK